MAKVILTGFIIVPPEELEVVVEALKHHTRLTLLEPGCLTFQITQCHSQLNRFELYEEFVDRQAFEEHQARAQASPWGEISANVERHYQVLE